MLCNLASSTLSWSGFCLPTEVAQGSGSEITGGSTGKQATGSLFGGGVVFWIADFFNKRKRIFVTYAF